MITVTQMFLPALNGIKSAVLNYVNFSQLSFKKSIFTDSNKIPQFFPDLEEFFPWTFPDLWATKRKTVANKLFLS